MRMQFDRKIKRAHTNCVKWDLEEKADTLPFWVADSDYATVPCVIDALYKRLEHPIFGYSIVPNTYYEVIQAWYQKSHHVSIDKDWIVPIPGVMTAVHLAIETFTEPGDKIVIQTPVYHQFYKVVEATKRIIVENPLINDDEKYCVDYLQLENAFKDGAKMMLLCSPHNPVGRVWSATELVRIKELCWKYHVLLVSDEIHSDIIIAKNQYNSMANYTDFYANLIIVSAPSKTFNLAGLKSSFAIIPSSILKEQFCQKYHEDYVPSVDLLAIEATIAAYKDGYKWMQMQNAHLTRNYQYICKKLSPYSNIKIAPLEGTYLLWLNLKGLGKSADELEKAFKDAGLHFNMGSDFGKNYATYIRMNIACPISQLKQGIKRFIKVIKAIDSAEE